MQALRPVPRISIQAFCETESVANPIERAGDDRRMSKAHLKVHMGGIATAIEFYQSAPTPNLIILESRREPRELLESLRQLAEYCDPSTKVVVIGHYNDVWLYRELIRSGISEYVVAPISMADIVGVIAGIFVDPDAEPIGRSIAFIGAKGGVGSSTIAHNVAWAMSTLFQSEVIVADSTCRSAPPTSISTRIRRKASPRRSSRPSASTRSISTGCSRNARSTCRCWPRRRRSTASTISTRRPSSRSSTRRSAARRCSCSTFRMCWNGWTKSTLMQADEVVITATPELANLRNTKNLVDMLKKLRPNDGPPRLIVNQAGMPKRPEISAADFAEPLGIAPMSVIPFEPQLFGNASNNGRMLGEMDAQNPIVQTISEIAHVLTGRSELKAKKKAGLGSLLGRLKLKKK